MNNADRAHADELARQARLPYHKLKDEFGLVHAAREMSRRAGWDYGTKNEVMGRVVDDLLAELAYERERCARIAESVTEIPMHQHWHTAIAAAIRAVPVEPQRKEGNTYFDTLRDLDPGGTMTEIIDASEARVAQQKEGQS